MPAFLATGLAALRSLSVVQKYLLAGTAGIILSMAGIIWMQSRALDSKRQDIATLEHNHSICLAANVSNQDTIDLLEQQLLRSAAAARARREAQIASLQAMRNELERQASTARTLRQQLDETITDDMRACPVPAATWRVLRQTADSD